MLQKVTLSYSNQTEASKIHVKIINLVEFKFDSSFTVDSGINVSSACNDAVVFADELVVDADFYVLDSVSFV